MSNKKIADGGPAFPFYRPEMRAAGGKVTRPHDERDGMSLRDYFAGQALPQAIEHERMLRASSMRPGGFRYDAIAEAAYVLADAMLKAREQEPTK